MDDKADEAKRKVMTPPEEWSKKSNADPLDAEIDDLDDLSF